MVFLDTTETRQHISELLKDASEAIYAVAFIGGGARGWLNLSEVNLKKLTIVCDAESGACNPDELSYLRDSVILRTKRGLHAKVFWTNNGVIIGSSNLSSNGLGFEDKEISRNIEASILSRDPKIIKEVRDWLDETVISSSILVSDALIQRCRKYWRQRRDLHDKLCAYPIAIPGLKSIAAVMQGDPNYFSDKNILLWVRRDCDASQAAYNLLEQCKLDRSDPDLDMYEVNGRKCGISQFQYIIDFYHDKVKISNGGMWQVTEKPFVKKGKTEILLVRRALMFEKLNYSGSVSYLKKFVAKEFKKNPDLDKIYPLSKVAREMKATGF